MNSLACRALCFAAFITGVLFAHSPSALAAPRTWNGSAGVWTDAAAWGGTVPEAGDTAAIAAGTVTVATATASLAGLTISGSGKLVFTGAVALVTANEISISGAGVRVEHTANTATGAVGGVWSVDGRIHFVCTNFVLGSGAILDANGRGWGSSTNLNRGYGYGAGVLSGLGAGYGGAGGLYGQIVIGSLPYGNAAAPDLPGSGGGGSYSVNAGGWGGGVVRIDAGAGRVEINGIVRADAPKPAIGDTGGGAGGSIWITCGVFAGSGTNTANGGNIISTSAGTGGGGRIAILYDPAKQALAVPVTALFQAMPGTNSSYRGDIGTLYFSDNQLLSTNLRHAGQWMAPGFTNWSPSSLTINGGRIRFPYLQSLTVGGDLTLTGTNAALELGGAELITNYPVIALITVYTPTLARFSTFSPQLTCTGNLALANGTSLRVFAGPTNNVITDGALVTVGGQTTMGSNAWIYPMSHPTNGGSPRFVLMQATTIAAGGGFNADRAGFLGRGGTANAGAQYGPGKGGSGSGGSYGGSGGGSAPGPLYGTGDPTRPFQPGSGGGSGNNVNFFYHGGTGGGLIRMDVRGALTLDGELRANGGNAGYYAGAGSGGGIYVQCYRLLGAASGKIWAKGGNGYNTESGGPGGGGRIAVWRRQHLFSGDTSAASGTTFKVGFPATDGDVQWCVLKGAGTIVTIR